MADPKQPSESKLKSAPKADNTSVDDLLKAIKSAGGSMGSSSFAAPPTSAAGYGQQAAKYPLTEQVAQLPAYSYQFKPQQAAETGRFGRYTGPMAQDMQQIPAMRDNVQMGPDGLLRVDAGQQTMTNTAAIAEMARRIKELEWSGGLDRGGRSGPERLGEDTGFGAVKVKKPSAGRFKEMGEKVSAEANREPTYNDLIAAIRNLKGEMPQPGGFSAPPPSQEEENIRKAKEREASAMVLSDVNGKYGY